MSNARCGFSQEGGDKPQAEKGIGKHVFLRTSFMKHVFLRKSFMDDSLELDMFAEFDFSVDCMFQINLDRSIRWKEWPSRVCPDYICRAVNSSIPVELKLLLNCVAPREIKMFLDCF